MFEYWKTPSYKRMVEQKVDARVAAAVVKEGFESVAAFIQAKTETDMLRTPGLGRKSVDKIKEMAKALGLVLGRDVSEPFAMSVQRRPAFGPVQQEWVLEIPFMQQSVLFAAIRAPDGLRKDHPTKVLLRWYRRCVLLSAFDRRALTCPFEEGGGSFTGPFKFGHVATFLIDAHHPDRLRQAHSQWYYGKGAPDHQRSQDQQREYRWKMFSKMREVYLRHVDEMPHHFQLHFMHAAQIVGCHHPSTAIRAWWREFYLMIVNDAHLQPESDADMNLRLSDNSDEWKKREWTPAK